MTAGKQEPDLRAAQVQRSSRKGGEGCDGTARPAAPSAWASVISTQDGPAGHPAQPTAAQPGTRAGDADRRGRQTAVERRPGPTRGAPVVIPAARRPPRRRPRHRPRRRSRRRRRRLPAARAASDGRCRARPDRSPGSDRRPSPAALSVPWAMAHPFRTDAPSRRKGGANDYDSNAGERSAPGFSSAGSKRVKGFTLRGRPSRNPSRRDGARAASSGTRGSRPARSACPSTRSRPSPGRARACRRR